MSKMDEQILVTSRKELFENESIQFQGVCRHSETINRLMNNLEKNIEIMRRGDAEENIEYKQPIPYVMIRKGNEIFLYKRLSGGGETRLHDKLSVGAGGHMNVTDHISFSKTLENNLLRELEEELNIQAEEKEFTTIGFINDDENEVGKVHIGLLVILDLDETAKVNVRETDQLQGEWVNLEKLLQYDIYSNLESWSQFAVDTLK